MQITAQQFIEKIRKNHLGNTTGFLTKLVSNYFDSLPQLMATLPDDVGDFVEWMWFDEEKETLGVAIVPEGGQPRQNEVLFAKLFDIYALIVH